MDTTLHLLIVSPDPKLPFEVKSALSGLAAHVVPHYATDGRQGVELARNRGPALALFEMTTDLRPLRTFADEMVAASPETTVAAIFRPDVFGPDVSESAVLIEAIRAGVSDFLRRPLSSADLDQLFGRVVRGGAAAGRIGVLGKVLSFVSNKGGVGKSTLAVAAACNLARTAPDRVLLVDASLQMGVCAATLDLRPATSLTDAARERDRLDETLVRQLALSHPCGLHLLAAPHDAIEAGEVDEEVISRVLMLARRSYDFVVVDTFPMLDQVVMAILDLSDRAYVVVESVVPTVLGAVQFLQLLDGLGIARDRQRVVLNRYARSLGHLTPADVADRLGRDIDAVVPFHKRVITGTNSGRPFVLDAQTLWGFGRALRNLSDDCSSAAVVPASRPARDMTPAAQNGPATPEEAPA